MVDRNEPAVDLQDSRSHQFYNVVAKDPSVSQNSGTFEDYAKAVNEQPQFDGCIRTMTHHLTDASVERGCIRQLAPASERHTRTSAVPNAEDGLHEQRRHRGPVSFLCRAVVLVSGPPRFDRRHGRPLPAPRRPTPRARNTTATSPEARRGHGGRRRRAGARATTRRRCPSCSAARSYSLPRRMSHAALSFPILLAAPPRALGSQQRRARRLVAATQDGGGEQGHEGRCVRIVSRALLAAPVLFLLARYHVRPP